VPRPLIDPRDHPPDRILLGRAEIDAYNPQRFEFVQIDAVLHWSAGENLLVAFRRVRADEFWVRGHIPGKPLFPGVLQAECLAQAGGLHTCLQMELGQGRFIGFGGIEKMRFRDAIEPGTDLWVAGRVLSGNRRRGVFKWGGQILRGDGRVAAEGTILGVVLGDAPATLSG